MNLSRHAHAFAATLALAAALGTGEWGAGQDPASYGWIGALEATSRYDAHPLPGTNSNEISGISPWSAMLGLKYLLGG